MRCVKRPQRTTRMPRKGVCSFLDADHLVFFSAFGVNSYAYLPPVDSTALPLNFKCFLPNPVSREPPVWRERDIRQHTRFFEPRCLQSVYFQISEMALVCCAFSGSDNAEKTHHTIGQSHVVRVIRCDNRITLMTAVVKKRGRKRQFRQRHCR